MDLLAGGRDERFYYIARRTYLSYRLALPEASYAEVSGEAGNSEAVLRKYYLAGVTPGRPAVLPTFPQPRLNLDAKAGEKPRKGKVARLASKRVPRDLAAACRRRGEDMLLFEKAVVRFFTHAARAIGAPKSVRAVYGVCFSSAGPVRYADVRRRLAMSAGTTSQSLGTLRQLGFLRHVRTKLDRRAFFVVAPDLRKLLARYPKDQIARRNRESLRRLVEREETIPRSRKGALLMFNDRVLALLACHRNLVSGIDSFYSYCETVVYAASVQIHCSSNFLEQ